MTVRIRLVADDLSGALDAAVHFAPLGPNRASWGTPSAHGLALSLETRDGPEPLAVERARASAPWLGGGGVAFLKCDSRLRGHVAATLATLVPALRPDRVVVAPAVPALGRIVREGRVRSRDAPDDPWRTEPVDLVADLARLGVKARRLRPGDAAPSGVSLWDGQGDADLDATAAAGLAAAGWTLWCGASGLAEALARRLGAPPPPGCAPAGPLLMIAGTGHPTTLAQIAHLRDAEPTLCAEVDASGRGAGEVADALGRGASRLVRVAVAAGATRAQAAAEVLRALDALVGRCPRPGALLVTGGATLLAAVERLGARAIALDGLFAPGVPVGRLVGGAWDGLPVVSKSGGFGGRTLLLDLVAKAGVARR